ncbi:uncharacterized protein LOC141536775 isoform X2 [Cotesia typhae]|uniref:uncharacterized protein LOC141536775 isoform X2 n=1 Tax=Cotesia typhae TaxID=2053667 RepID=UPI003D695221
MDCHRKMIVRPIQNYKPKENVADEDEDDLEALRLAALMSLKAKPSKIPPPPPPPPPQKSFLLPRNSYAMYTSNNNIKNHGNYRGRRDFYQNRPLVRQNGNQNVYHPSRNNKNLIEIIPMEENTPTDGEDKKDNATSEKENSKFRRYDDASGSEDEDIKPKDPIEQPSSSLGDLPDSSEPPKEDSQTDSDPGEAFESGLQESTSPKEEEPAPATEEENADSDNEAEKEDEDDDDVLLMADYEEEDSLERLMDEMEREMADKPLEKKEKKPRRDKVKKEKPKAAVSASTSAASNLSYKATKSPESPYERPRHRSPSPKAKRKKSPRRSPARLKKIRQRSPRRSPAPRSPKRLLSPRRRSRSRSRSPRSRRSPRSKSPRPRSPVRSSRSPKISPRRVSPRRISPHSPIHSPWTSPINSPKRRRSPVASLASSNFSGKDNDKDNDKEKESRKKRSRSPEESKESSEASDPVLEARRRKFESTKLIDPVNDNKKIKLSRKADEEDTVEDLKVNLEEDVEEGELQEISDEEKVTEGNENEELAEDPGLCLDESYDLDELEEHVSDEAVFESVKMEKKLKKKKKKKKDKEIYQVGKLKELPLSERLGKKKKCKKRKEYDGKSEEANSEEVVDEEADLRTELSRRRAERLNRNAPIQSARLLQSAFKGVVNEVAKSNSKVLQRQLIKEDKHPQKEIRRVTVLHRSIPELHDSEDEMIDSKVPIKFRLGLNKVQETRETKSSRKSSKRQGRKGSKKNTH